MALSKALAMQMVALVDSFVSGQMQTGFKETGCVQRQHKLGTKP
jgi:hypothetical protein